MENEPISLIITVNGNYNGDVSYRRWNSYDEGYTVKMINGYAAIEGTYEEGIHNFEFTIEENPFYNKESKIFTFYVYTLPISTFMDEMDWYVGLSAEFGNARPENPIIYYTINNVTKSFVANGIVKLNVSDLTEPCEIFLRYDGDDTFSGCNMTLYYIVPDTENYKNFSTQFFQ